MKRTPAQVDVDGKTGRCARLVPRSVPVELGVRVGAGRGVASGNDAMVASLLGPLDRCWSGPAVAGHGPADGRRVVSGGPDRRASMRSCHRVVAALECNTGAPKSCVWTGHRYPSGCSVSGGSTLAASPTGASISRPACTNDATLVVETHHHDAVGVPEVVSSTTPFSSRSTRRLRAAPEVLQLTVVLLRMMMAPVTSFRLFFAWPGSGSVAGTWWCSCRRAGRAGDELDRG